MMLSAWEVGTGQSFSRTLRVMDVRAKTLWTSAPQTSKLGVPSMEP